MKIFEYLERIDHAHKLLLERITGTPDEFAKQLGISRTCLYELIDELRSRGAPIVYSKSCKTFYYKQPFDIMIKCNLKPLTSHEKKENVGGSNYFSQFFFPVRYIPNFMM